MSCNNTESGTIRIPAREWAGLKKTVRDAAIQHRQVVQNELATAIEWLNDNGASFTAGDTHSALNAYTRRVPSRHRSELIENLMYEGLEALAHQSKKGTFYLPTEKTIDALVGKKPTNKTVLFSDEEAGEWTIAFDNATKAVEWSVSENNRAVERAHEDPVAIALFAALRKVRFGAHKHLGGVITGNDEYRQEAGDGDYVVMRFGEAGKKY